MPEGVRSKHADGSAIARLAQFEGKSIRDVAPMMLARPTMHQTARFVQRSDRRNSGRVRILQQASVMLGHCRMRSRSKPQLHARSAVGSSGPDEPRGWAGEGRSSPARNSVPANRIDGGWLLDLKGRRRAFYTTKLPALKTPAPRSYFALRSTRHDPEPQRALPSRTLGVNTWQDEDKCIPRRI